MLKSPCSTILGRGMADRDRVISRWTHPYCVENSPYTQTDFDPIVQNALQSNQSKHSGLKICKAIIVGDVSVGKTCLVNRFCKKLFDTDYKATIGVDFEVERFDIAGLPFNLQFWDTAGQERFRCIAAAYYRGAHVLIIVFDLSDPESLKNIKHWQSEATQDNESSPLQFLVGTKRDLCESKDLIIMENKAKAISQEIGAEYWSVSAKENSRVTEFFQRVASLTFNESMKRELEQASTKKVIATGSVVVYMSSTDLVHITDPGELVGNGDRSKPSYNQPLASAKRRLMRKDIKKQQTDIYDKSNRSSKCCT